jgi:hypothetical protein
MCRLLLLTGSVIQLGRLCSAQSEQCLRLGEDQAALLYCYVIMAPDPGLPAPCLDAQLWTSKVGILLL